MKSHERKLLVAAISFLIEDYADAVVEGEAVPTDVLKELDFDDVEAVNHLRTEIYRALGLRVDERTLTHDEALKAIAAQQ